MEQRFGSVDDFDSHENEDEDTEENWGTEFTDETAVNFLSTEERQDCVTGTKVRERSEDREQVITRMELNDHKAGMQGLDKEKINQIIFEASKGSRFYESEQRKEKQVAERITVQTERLRKFTSQQRRDALKETDRIVRELEESRDLSRVIVHIDMDAFYAAVEMRDNPRLRDIPMAVGSNAMLSTSNYPARKYGVRAAMPGFIAKKLCPHLVIVPLNFEKYREVSSHVREILADYDKDFAPMSLDEAYLDLTDYVKKRQTSSLVKTFTLKSCAKDSSNTTCHTPGEKPNQNSPMNTASVSNDFGSAADKSDVDSTIYGDTVTQVTNSCMANLGRNMTEVDEEHNSSVKFGCSVEEIVKELRFRIEQKTQLTASAGIAPNTMLAKICSDKNKPNGQYYLKSNQSSVMSFVKDLPVRKVSGIGRVSEQMLKALGIITCEDLFAKRDLLYLLHSPVSFKSLIEVSLGLGATHLESDRERQSISTETTFSEINQPWQLHNKCMELSHMLAEDVQKEGLAGKTVTIKLKTVNFETKTRAVSMPNAISSADEIFVKAKELLENEIKACLPKPLRLRLLGVRLSNLKKPNEARKSSKQETITEIMERNCMAGEDSLVTEKQLHSNTKSDKLPTDCDSRAGKSFICPVCGIPQLYSIDNCLEKFNEHLDSCLKNYSRPQTTTTESVEMDSSSTLENLWKKCIDDSNCLTNSSVLSFEDSFKQESCSFTTLDVDTKEKKLCGSDPVVNKMICPVCNALQNLTCEDYLKEFNRHVDLCLNKAEIKKLVSLDKEHSNQFQPQKNPSQGKRKRKPSEATSKRITLNHFWSK